MAEDQPPPREDHNAAAAQLSNHACRVFGYLANHMPLGSFFCYKILSNVVFSNRTLTTIFSITSGSRLGNLFLCFTDASRANGRIRYALAGAPKVEDYVHAISSTALFAAVALTDQNSVNAFYPGRMSHGTLLFLRWVPIIVAFASGFAVIRWPSKRRGIGYFAARASDWLAWLLERLVKDRLTWAAHKTLFHTCMPFCLLAAPTFGHPLCFVSTDRLNSVCHLTAPASYGLKQASMWCILEFCMIIRFLNPSIFDNGSLPPARLTIQK